MIVFNSGGSYFKSISPFLLKIVRGVKAVDFCDKGASSYESRFDSRFDSKKNTKGS